jgi:GntR family transcriptional regulator
MSGHICVSCCHNVRTLWLTGQDLAKKSGKTCERGVLVVTRSGDPIRGAARLRRGAGRSLWEQLLDDLTRRLRAGEFRDAFPGEIALCDEYQVSRHTVREALRRLREAGEVIAEPGRPPRIASEAEVHQPLGALYSLFASVEAAGLPQLSVVRTLDIRADGVVADRLGLDGSEPLLHLERLRLAGGETLAVDRLWLPASIARPLLEADFTRTALYDELATRCSVRLTGGHETLRAVVPTAAERRLLDIDERTAAFAIDRLGYAGTTPVEWRQTLVRGDRFSVGARFSGRDGLQVDLGASSHAAGTGRAGR